MSVDLRVSFADVPSAVWLHARAEESGTPSAPHEAAAEAGVSAPSVSAPSVEAGRAGDDAASEPPPPAPPPATPDWSAQTRRFESLVEQVEAATASLATEIESDLRALREDVVDLAVDMAERIVGAAARDGRVDLAGAVEEAIDRVCEGLRTRRDVTVRVAPDDFDMLKRMLGERLDEPERFRFQEDPALAPGRCEMRCEMRRVHVDLVNEMARLRQHVGVAEDRDEG